MRYHKRRSETGYSRRLFWSTSLGSFKLSKIDMASHWGARDGESSNRWAIQRVHQVVQGARRRGKREMDSMRVMATLLLSVTRWRFFQVNSSCPRRWYSALAEEFTVTRTIHELWRRITESLAERHTLDLKMRKNPVDVWTSPRWRSWKSLDQTL